MFKNDIREQIARSGQLLQCGGAAGHVMHLFDNKSLTFAELKDALTQAADGKLESVTEKLDGVNLMFTWDQSKKQIKAARNLTNIKSGGLNAKELAQKFAGRGNVEDAFNSGFKVLKQAVMSLPPDVLKQVFGAKGNVWYSIEIIYDKLEITVRYDSNNIVFHQSPIYVVENGKIATLDDHEGVSVLASHIASMQTAVKMKNWAVRGPSIVRLKKIADGSILNDAISKINQLQQEANVSDSQTISEFMFNIATEDLERQGYEKQFAKDLAARITQRPGAKNLTLLKKQYPDQAFEASDMIKRETTLRRNWIKPLEHVIHDFAIEVLKGLESSLISDSNAEVSRLRSQLQQAINKIQASGDEDAMNVLSTQMQKLKSVENLASPMEGVVFKYKDKSYKFTGAFAPAHQIMSILRFKRGVTESIDRHLIREQRIIQTDAKNILDLSVDGPTGRILYECVFDHVAHEQLQNEQGTYTKTTYRMIDNKLYKVRFSRKGALSETTMLPRVLATWRPIERQFVSNNPNKFIFDESEFKTIKQLVESIGSSNVTSHMSKQILKAFQARIEMSNDR